MSDREPESGTEPMMLSRPDLRAIYRSLYDTLPWPEPIPDAAQVIFMWSRHITCQLGSCHRTAKMITISPLYEDSRLRGELDHLMAHEASHFIWSSHSKAFKEFLRRAGVSEPYRRARGLSDTVRAVEADRLQRYCTIGALRRRQPTSQMAFPFDD